jgi:hypothetical protein
MSTLTPKANGCKRHGQHMCAPMQQGSNPRRRPPKSSRQRAGVPKSVLPLFPGAERLAHRVPAREEWLPSSREKMPEFLSSAWWWHASFNRVYTVTVRARGPVQGPLDIMQVHNWHLLISYMSMPHPHLDWQRLEHSWRVPPEPIIDKLIKQLFGTVRRQRATACLDKRLMMLRLPPARGACVSVPGQAFQQAVRDSFHSWVRHQPLPRWQRQWMVNKVAFVAGRLPQYIDRANASHAIQHITKQEIQETVQSPRFQRYISFKKEHASLPKYGMSPSAVQ